MVNHPIGNHWHHCFKRKTTAARFTKFAGYLHWGVRYDVVRFDLGPLFQGQTRIAKLKSAYNSLIIDPRGLGW